MVGLLLYLVADIPEHAAHGHAALQHQGAAGQIGVEVPHIRPPRLLAQKRRSNISAKRRAGEVAIGIGVVGVGVEDGVSYALHHVLVSHLAEHAQVLVPRQVERRERLCRHARLAVHARCRGRGADGLVVVVREPVAERLPVLGHGHVGIFVELHRVAGEDVARRRLVAHRHPPLVSQAAHQAVEIVGEEFVDGAAPVREEFARLPAVVHHPPEDGRHPREQVVVAAAEEFLLHVARPRLRRALPTVHQHIVHQPLQRSVGQAPDVAAELIGHELLVELVHLPPCGLGRCRTVLAACVHVPYAQNHPPACRRLPTQTAVGRHQLAQVNDICTADEAAAALVHILRQGQQPARRPARLHLPVVAARGGGEAQARDCHRVAVGDFEHVLPALLPLGQREGHRLLIILPVGVREVGIEDYGLCCIQNAQMNVGLHAELMVEIVDRIKLNRARHSTIIQLHTNAMGLGGG